MTPSGIYKITHRDSGRVYVGSAVDLRRRKRNHFAALSGGRHCNAKLQRAWNKYGRDAFDFSVMLLCGRNSLLMYEQRAIDVLAACGVGFNLAPMAGSTMGAKYVGRRMPPQSDEARRNKAIAAIGRKRPIISAAARQKISDAMRGMKRGPQSAEHRAKLAAAKLGRKLSGAHKAAIAASHRARFR